MKNALFISFLITLALAQHTYAATTTTPNTSLTDSGDSSSDVVVADNSGTDGASDTPSTDDTSSLNQQAADALAAQPATATSDAPTESSTKDANSSLDIQLADAMANTSKN